MHINFINTPKPSPFTTKYTPDTNPDFVSYSPNFEVLEFIKNQYDHYTSLVIIGNGGSVNPFLSFYGSLKDKVTKEVYFVSTVDPDFINEVKSKTNPETTLVITISKSGQTVSQIEATKQFTNYKLLAITDKQSALGNLVAVYGGEIVEHPPTIGGRFTGLTEVALIPASLCGIDVKALFHAGHELLSKFNEDNPAFHAASVCFELENKGFVDVYAPVYNHYLASFGAIITQLNHETYGKNSLGQTWLVMEAPESQHHTNQRYFGGRGNMVGFFTSVENTNTDIALNFLNEEKAITVHNHALSDYNAWSLNKSLHAELVGTVTDAQNKKMPIITLALPKRDEESLGKLMAFWEMFAVYSAELRGEEPLDQPAVEASKDISAQLRFTK